MHKKWVIDRMVNNIQLTWKLTWVLRTCNSTVRFSKYKFYNKLLDCVILLRVKSNITWTQHTHTHTHTHIGFYDCGF